MRGYNRVLKHDQYIRKALKEVDRNFDINPKIWGPSYWKLIHNSSVRYNPNAKETNAWKSFLTVFLPKYLPCAKCRQHYKKNVTPKIVSKALRSTQSLVLFLKRLHDKVTTHVRLEKRVSRMKHGHRYKFPIKRVVYNHNSFVHNYIADVL